MDHVAAEEFDAGKNITMVGGADPLRGGEIPWVFSVLFFLKVRIPKRDILEQLCFGKSPQAF